MSYISGTAGSVAVVSGGTTLFAGATEWSLDLGQNTPEVTAFGDSWRNYLPGIREWTGAVTLHADPADSAQTTARNLIINGSAPVTFRFYAGTNYYSGSALVTGQSPTITFDGVYDSSIDLQGCGPLSYT